MRWALAPALLACGLSLPCTATGSSNASATTKKSASSDKKAVTRARGKSTRRATRKSGPALPAHPDPERYQQIQQALADRGYFKGEVNGKWDPDSVEALKHFQADQKLEPDGKINSLSLIGLGLGPKHDGSSNP